MDEYQDKDLPALDDLPEGLPEAVAAEITDAISYMDDAVIEQQARMTEFYRGDLPGVTEEDAENNRSDIVSRDVHDAVQAALPDLVRTFLGAEHVVEFRPGGPDDEEVAPQATDVVRYIFEKENDAFSFIYGALKDGLVRRYAVATWWHEVEDLSFHRDYTGLSIEDLTSLLDEPGVKPLRVTEEEPTGSTPVDPVTGNPAVTYSARLLHERTEHRYRVELIPPEELLVSRRARHLDGTTFVGRRRELTVDELEAMGYNREELLELAGDTAGLADNELAFARNPDSTDPGPARSDDGAKSVLYVEGYIRWPIDGRLQLVRVCCLGSAHSVKRWELVDSIPMALWTPDPEPHTVFGESWAEKVADIQRLKTGVWRGIMDSLAEALVPRTEVVEGQVNLDDAMNNEIGALVRVRAPGMVRPISQPFVGQQAFPLLDLADRMREDRVGSLRTADGLSAEAMQSSTRMAVAATIHSSKAQKELLARGFAETFLKPIFRGLLRLFVENQDKPKVIRLRGSWVPVDPRGWNADMDADVNVALALSSTEERLTALTAIVQKQEQILQTLGPQNPLVTLAQYSGTLRRMVELLGYKSPDPFFNRVDPNWQPPPPPPPPPDPSLLLAQAQVQAIQQEQARKDAEAARKAEFEAERMRRDDDFRRDKLAQEGVLARAEMELKYATNLATVQAEIDAKQAADREAAVDEVLK